VAAMLVETQDALEHIRVEGHAHRGEWMGHAP
jgi:hypothetical protein